MYVQRRMIENWSNIFNGCWNYFNEIYWYLRYPWYLTELVTIVKFVVVQIRYFFSAKVCISLIILQLKWDTRYAWPFIIKKQFWLKKV